MTTAEVVTDPIPVPAILERLLDTASWTRSAGEPGTRPLDNCAGAPAG